MEDTHQKQNEIYIFTQNAETFITSNCAPEPVASPVVQLAVQSRQKGHHCSCGLRIHRVDSWYSCQQMRPPAPLPPQKNRNPNFGIWIIYYTILQPSHLTY